MNESGEKQSCLLTYGLDIEDLLVVDDLDMEVGRFVFELRDQLES